MNIQTLDEQLEAHRKRLEQMKGKIFLVMIYLFWFFFYVKCLTTYNLIKIFLCIN